MNYFLPAPRDSNGLRRKIRIPEPTICLRTVRLKNVWWEAVSVLRYRGYFKKQVGDQFGQT